MATHTATHTATYMTLDQSFVPEPFGMNNTGVLCWCNAVLQALWSCSSLNQTLMENRHEFIENKFALQYIRLLDAVLPNDPGQAVSPAVAAASENILRAFLMEMTDKKEELKLNFNIGSRQESACEAIDMIIALFNNPRVTRLFSCGFELQIKCPACKKIVSSTRDDELVIKIPNTFHMDDKKSFTNYLIMHSVEYTDYRCGECGELTASGQRFEVLKRSREILVLLFTGKFIEKTINWFPSEITFGALPRGSFVNYKLVATIEHEGNMFGGHYYSVVSRGDETFCINDSQVTRTELKPLSTTYMVIYHMV